MSNTCKIAFEHGYGCYSTTIDGWNFSGINNGWSVPNHLKIRNLSGDFLIVKAHLEGDRHELENFLKVAFIVEDTPVGTSLFKDWRDKPYSFYLPKGQAKKVTMLFSAEVLTDWQAGLESKWDFTFSYEAPYAKEELAGD